jgi:hypothetical protein
LGASLERKNQRAVANHLRLLALVMVEKLLMELVSWSLRLRDGPILCSGEKKSDPIGGNSDRARRWCDDPSLEESHSPTNGFLIPPWEPFDRHLYWLLSRFFFTACMMNGISPSISPCSFLKFPPFSLVKFANLEQLDVWFRVWNVEWMWREVDVFGLYIEIRCQGQG